MVISYTNKIIAQFYSELGCAQNPIPMGLDFSYAGYTIHVIRVDWIYMTYSEKWRSLCGRSDDLEVYGSMHSL
jgi:hypothetical protein